MSLYRILDNGEAAVDNAMVVHTSRASAILYLDDVERGLREEGTLDVCRINRTTLSYDSDGQLAQMRVVPLSYYAAHMRESASDMNAYREAALIEDAFPDAFHLRDAGLIDTADIDYQSVADALDKHGFSLYHDGQYITATRYQVTTYTVVDDFDESFVHDTNMTLSDALIEALREAAHESKEYGQAFYVLNDGGQECDVFFLQAVGGPDGHGIHVRNTRHECVAQEGAAS